MTKTKRRPTKPTPAREQVQRINVDFPIDLLARIDEQVAVLGIPRQAWIKLRLLDVLSTLEGGNR
jgi:hypothetical protein